MAARNYLPLLSLDTIEKPLLILIKVLPGCHHAGSTTVSDILKTANENRSQITCYAVNSDWLFIMYYVLKSIDHTIFIENVMLQELQKLQ